MMHERKPYSVIFAEQMQDLHGRKALDLACGSGRNAIYLAKKGWDVTAVDISKERVEFGREAAEAEGLSLSWVVDDLVEYQPEKDAYDLVCMCYLHILWPDMQKVLHKAAAALRPEGRLIVIGHDLSNLDEGTGGPRNPELLYTPDDITRELGDLTVETAKRQHRGADHGDEDPNRTPVDCVVRAKKGAP
ncbi:MAG: class I SAM-dependent methyltransferase [Spirochaetota bacterium]